MNWAMAREVGLFTYLSRRVFWRLIKRRGKAVMFRLPAGEEVLLPLESPFAADIYCTRGYLDWGAEQLLVEYLQTQPQGVCIDVGANMGYYSCLLAPYASEVIAFEPDSRNHAALLSQNVANLTLVPQAVSDTVGIAFFDVSDASTVGHLDTGADRAGRIQIETTTLDECRKTRGGVQRVMAVKMDVEGYEILGLRGADRLAKDCQPVFLIEFGMGEGLPNSIAALEDWIGRHGYQIYAMVRRPTPWWKYRTCLEKTRPDALPSLVFKMLFLVPEGDTFFHAKSASGFCFELMRDHA